eukprot:4580032-Amphidinium_carterae.1
MVTELNPSNSYKNQEEVKGQTRDAFEQNGEIGSKSNEKFESQHCQCYAAASMICVGWLLHEI